MPKIAIYAADIPSTTFIERLITGLASDGNEVYVFGKQKGDISYSSGIKVVAYKNNISKGWQYIKYYALLLLKKPGQLRRLKQIFSEGDKLSYRHKLSISMPVLYHKPDVFHIQWAKAVDDWMWVKEFGIKIVLSLRGTHINYSPVTVPGLADIYRRNFPNIDGFHAVCNAIARKAEAYGATNIKTVYSGLNIAEYDFGSTEKKENTLNILSIGRWHWVKGYDYALNGMQVLKEKGISFHYTIIGGSETEEALFNIVDTGLQKHISFMRLMPHAALKEYMHAADILLLPSIEEGIANVVLEAMAYGTIVIATNCGGMSEAITDGENGFLVPIRNSEAIAEKLIEVAMLSDAEKKLIRKKARKTIEEKFRADSMIEGMKNLYRAVLT